VIVRLLPVALFLVACTTSAESQSGDDDGPEVPGGCEAATGCAPAGVSCCECPSHALPIASGWQESCEDVECGVPASCPATEAACVDGSCILRCLPVTCDTVCAGGYRADLFGCLVCECNEASPPSTQCAMDDDCTRVPADCCGCAQGGADTAVPAAEVGAYLTGLDCADAPACPGVDVCDPDAAARCVGGQCMLTSAPAIDGGGDSDAGAGTTPTPGQPCGTPDLPPCPPGQVCVLNDPAAGDESMAGLGVCREA
jgi:hypothetical protein